MDHCMDAPRFSHKHASGTDSVWIRYVLLFRFKVKQTRLAERLKLLMMMPTKYWVTKTVELPMTRILAATRSEINHLLLPTHPLPPFSPLTTALGVIPFFAWLQAAESQARYRYCILHSFLVLSKSKVWPSCRDKGQTMGETVCQGSWMDLE